MIRLEDFWSASMTQLRRVSTNELMTSEFIIANKDAKVHSFFPNITTCEIMVVLVGDLDEFGELAEEY